MIKLLQTAEQVVETVAVETAAAKEMSLWEMFNAGGWLMWVLVVLGGITIFIFVD